MIALLQRLRLMLWAGLLLACLLVIAQTTFVSDLSAFMPQAPSARQQLLVDQFHDGVIGRLIMIGIEGGDERSRAAASRDLANTLRSTGLFIGIQNGDPTIEQRDRAYFFQHRYLLSPAITAQHFTASALHDAIRDTLDQLSGSMGLLIQSLFTHDPTGETLQLLDPFSGSDPPNTRHQAWASQDGTRAVLLAYTRAPGNDIDAQAHAMTLIRQTFRQLPQKPIGLHLVMSGPGVFSVNARNTIQKEVTKLASASLLLVMSLLLLVYRSPKLLLLGLLPVLSGTLVGIAMVSLVFGKVHGLTLGFGTTLIGEAVDYSIYFYLQRAGHFQPTSFWRTIWLGVATSIAGFAALLASTFPGLAQLGVYSISGLIAAVLVTRYILPALLPATYHLPDLSRPAQRLDSWLGYAGRLRHLPWLLTLAACFVIAQHHNRLWNRDLAALSPINQADQQLDQRLRHDLGAPDLRYMVAFNAMDQEHALQGAERIGALLSHYRPSPSADSLAFTSPAMVLPSQALQRQRQQALPDATTLSHNLEQALQSLPVKPETLSGFLADIRTAKQQKLLSRTDLQGTSAVLLVDSLVIRRAHDYLMLIPLQPSTHQDAFHLNIRQLQADLQGAHVHHLVVIDLLEESTNLFDTYRQEIVSLSGLGCLIIMALLGVALHSWSRTLRVAAPLFCAVLCVTALLLASGTTLTILHLVGLLLVVAIGSNYALFFENSAFDPATTPHQMPLSLAIATTTTVGSFGILGLSPIAVLSAIGSTVSLGALLSLVFSAILARPPSRNATPLG